MNTQDFYAALVSETTENFAALRNITQLDDARSAFSGEEAVATWTVWYAAAEQA